MSSESHMHMNEKKKKRFLKVKAEKLFLFEGYSSKNKHTQHEMSKTKFPEVITFGKSKRSNLFGGKEKCRNYKKIVNVGECGTTHDLNDFFSFNIFSILKIEEALVEGTGKDTSKGLNTSENNEEARIMKKCNEKGKKREKKWGRKNKKHKMERN